MGRCVNHCNVSWSVRGTLSHVNAHQPQLWREKRADADSNRCPSAYLPRFYRWAKPVHMLYCCNAHLHMRPKQSFVGGRLTKLYPKSVFKSYLTQCGAKYCPERKTHKLVEFSPRNEILYPWDGLEDDKKTCFVKLRHTHHPVVVCFVSPGAPRWENTPGFGADVTQGLLLSPDTQTDARE